MREAVGKTDQPLGFDEDIKEVEHAVALTDPLLELGEAGGLRLRGQALEGVAELLICSPYEKQK